jgi:hypothetical protein
MLLPLLLLLTLLLLLVLLLLLPVVVEATAMLLAEVEEMRTNEACSEDDFEREAERDWTIEGRELLLLLLLLTRRSPCFLVGETVDKVNEEGLEA